MSETNEERKNIIPLNKQNQESPIITQLYNLPKQVKAITSQSFAPMALVFDKETGKTNKFPINPTTGEFIKWKKEPDRILTLSPTMQFLKIQNAENIKRLRLGILLKENLFADGQDLIVIDIDHREDLVEQARTQKITSDDVQAQVVKYALESGFYIEISQSGAGLHILLKGHKENTKLIRNDKFEYYDSNRWLCLTGNSINHNFKNRLEVDEKTIGILESVMFTKEDRERSQKQVAPAQISHAKFDDKQVAELIKKAKNAKNGEKFTALLNGESPSQNVSDDDLSFVCQLAFWTQRNPQMMDYIFRHSSRMRDKWDEVHDQQGNTYGEMTIEKAISATTEVYHPPFVADKSKIHSKKDQLQVLVNAREAWDKAHTYKDDSGHIKTTKITTQTLEIIKILIDNVNFAVIYSVESQADKALYFYDYDTGIYSRDERDLEQMILAVAPEITNTKTRQNLLDTIFKLPTSKIPVQQNLIATDQGKHWLAVGNGILNIDSGKLVPFSPNIFITSKIDTNYNEKACTEPSFNGWSWSQNLQRIADGDEKKLKLLWETCKAGVLGIYWLREAVLLVDDGHGMTGKSTFEDAITGVVGRSNTAQLRFAEMSDETKLVDAVDKRLIIGDDNDVYTVINRYDYLNPVISSELIRVRDYYHKSQSTALHAFVLQSANGVPPFKNSTQAFFNRLVFIQFNHRHDSSKEADWRVKNEYIKTQEFREWLLWYVVNKVQIGYSLTKTEESKQITDEAQEETNTVRNFILNWMPELRSSRVPAPWLYDLYTTSCVIDGVGKALSRKRFTRELEQNELFKKNWEVKNSRVNSTNFMYGDVQMLIDYYNSTRWGKDLKTWFPITTLSNSYSDGEIRETKRVVTEEDYNKKLESFHGKCYIKTEQAKNQLFGKPVK